LINKKTYDSIVVLGPTASGKTRLAVKLAGILNGEILSADARMVYKKMDIGTGKDLQEYFYNNKAIPYHLINLVDPNTSYHIYQYQQDFKIAFQLVQANKKIPIICGGSGLYIEAVIKDYQYTAIPINEHQRLIYLNQDYDDLLTTFKLMELPEYKKTADVATKKRLIRAIEIGQYLMAHPNLILPDSQSLNPIIIGLNPNLEMRRENILLRLQSRLKEGLIEEVEGLMNVGVEAKRLAHFGLEYKWISSYLLGNTGKEQMAEKLGIAIQQFAKRQMTYFRKMEKSGLKIHWIKQESEAFELLSEHFINTDFGQLTNNGLI
jgi:tRNA dimethylallyltransferase